MKHQLLLASAGLAAALALVVARRGGAPRAVRGAGTLPPHRDPDGGFRNPWRTAHREGGFLRWQRERLGADLPPNPPPGALPLVPNHLARPHAAPDEIRLTWVGHATWVLQIGGLNLLTDPHWSERAFPVQWAGPARFQPPGIRWDDLPAIDAVLLSHDHYDHLDRNTVHRLRERFGERLRWLVPLGYRAWFRGEGVDVAELDWWQTATLDGPAGPVRVTCLPSQHWTRRTLWDERERLWSSWAVGGGGRRVVLRGGYRVVSRLRGDRPARGSLRRAALPHRRVRAALVHAPRAHEPRRRGAGVPGDGRARSVHRDALGHLAPHRRGPAGTADPHSRGVGGGGPAAGTALDPTARGDAAGAAGRISHRSGVAALSTLPISDYALLSDCHSAALVSRGGSVDWLCLPRFDSPALFAHLLDPAGGHWWIRPAGEHTAERRYLDGTLVLQTTFRTPNGVVTLEDALAVGRGERGHELGRTAPHALLRRVRCTEGTVQMETEYTPRPEYGLIRPLLREEQGGIRGRGGASALLLSASHPPRIDGSVARGRWTLRAGEGATFALQQRRSAEQPPELWSPERISARLDDTTRAWRSWSELHQGYGGPWRDEVRHSGRVLQALTYVPTGAIIAAPTTSLPEAVGGDRNWDYRYAWVRDASLTLQALWVAACPDEADRFFRFLAGAASEMHDGDHLQVVFGVEGEHDLSERELSRLAGWRDSRPVRVGNGAWRQQQLDVYGELLAAAYLLRDRLGELDQPTRAFLASLADTAAERWEERDHGIWEIRGEPRDYVYSKLMCWVALDRAIRLAEPLRAEGRVEHWTEVRERIRDTILQRGWNDAAGAFTQSFGSDALDASSLMLPIVGFLPATHPRIRSTVHAIRERLTDSRGLIRRYRSGDGLPGHEGSFLLCTFWLAHVHALAGEVEQARHAFESAARFLNDVGLLSEEVGDDGELLGNFPQGLSHLGLVNAAWAIAEAERAAG